MEAQQTQKTISIANYILRTNSTIRQTALAFKLSKSTIHNELTKKLPKVNFILYKKVKKLLEFNFAIKHIRGGQSTKHKYTSNKKNVTYTEKK